MKEKSPAPGNYSPMVNFNENRISIHAATGRAIFPKDERKCLEDKLYKYKDVPGPG